LTATNLPRTIKPIASDMGLFVVGLDEIPRTSSGNAPSVLRFYLASSYRLNDAIELDLIESYL
jgi:hypothetical protein